MVFLRILFLSFIILLFVGCKSNEPKVKKVQNPYNLKYSQRLVALSNYLIASKPKDLKKEDGDKFVLDSIQKAFVAVYGKPYLQNNIKYSPQDEMYYGYIKSTKGDFSQKISIEVPISEAETFKLNLENVVVDVVFDYSYNTLSLKKVVIKKLNKIYPSRLIDRVFVSQNLIDTTNLMVATLPKKKFQPEKEVKYNGGFDDIGEFLRKVKPHKKDVTKWLFIVGVEKYEYTNPVIYSENSAKDFEKVMKKRFGIPERNIRTLINLGATSAKIHYKLKDMLRRVKEGDTIYFYYSGHGIPVPSKNNAPYMLAQDMNPAYIDDDRFKLQNIYKQLSNSKATKIIAFIDSCFSGGTDNQQLIKGVAATRIKPKKITFDKSKMVVISAGSGIQYSNKYDAKRNRLFSYYLMRGLMKNNQNTKKLYDFVKSNVADKSYEMGASYEQIPVYDGNIGMKL